MKLLRDFVLTLIAITLLFGVIFLHAEWSNKTVDSVELYPFSAGDKTWLLEVRYKDMSPLSVFLNRNLRILVLPDDLDRWFETYKENLKLQNTKKKLNTKFFQKWKNK